ncbi:hypothetical protein Pst134EB_031032 [Puccinia striiformis f. sp. tritici]|nr:hypothetical protein Pst134EB_031032 [Puccinia striiformis f. sp. tritici]
MADPPNTSLPGGNDPPKEPAPPKKTDSPKGGGSSSSKSAGKNPTADHYVELLLKLQHTAALQLQEERQLNIEQRHADRERIAQLENTLFDVVTKAEEEKTARLTPAPKSNRLDLQKFRIADGPSFKGSLHDIEPFLKWITQLEIFFSTKGVIHDDNKVCVTGGLLENTRLLDFYVSEGPAYIGKSWTEFKTRLFEVALPQRWRNTLRTKLRQLAMGPKESFITFSGRARTLQTLINFDLATSSNVPTSATPPSARLSDFDLAEFVTLGVTEELRSEIAKFALLDADPFLYSAFEKRAAVFDENTIRSPAQRSQHPLSIQLPTQSSSLADYKPPQAHGSSTSNAGKPTHPPAGRPPFRAASLAAVTESPDDKHHDIDSGYTDVVDAIEEDDQAFVEAASDDNLPPDLTTADWAIFREIDDIRSDNVAVVEEDATSNCDSTYCSDLGRDPFDSALPTP